MKTKTTGLLSLITLIIFMTLTLGYIINIFKFANSNFEKPYKREIIHGLGIFIPPIGSIIGWTKIKDN